MERNQQEIADQVEGDEVLQDNPEDLMQAEIIAQQPQLVSQSGGNSNSEVAKGGSAEGQNQKGEDGPLPTIPENMRSRLQSGGSSTVERRRSDKSSEKMKHPVEDLNDSLPSRGNLNIKEEQGQPEAAAAAVAVGGKRKWQRWNDGAVMALLEAHHQQLKKNPTDWDWDQITNEVNAADNSGTPRTREACKAKFETLNSEFWANESNSTFSTKGLRDWYAGKKKRL